VIGGELNVSRGPGGDIGLTLMLGGAIVLAAVVKTYMATPYDPIFDAAGAEHGISPNLLRAIARKESAFRASAVSPKNPNGSRDFGVMQISSPNFAKLGLTDASAMEPQANIRAGARLLAMMKRELGGQYTYHNIISAYNAGTPTVKARGIINPAYVGEVSTHHTLYELGRLFA